MPKGQRANEVLMFKRLMNCNKLIGLAKGQNIETCIDLSTMLTQEPSFPIPWTQMYCLLILCIKTMEKEELDKADFEAAEKTIAGFSTAWIYMTEKSPQKGMIHARLAKKHKRTGGDSDTDDAETTETD